MMNDTRQTELINKLAGKQDIWVAGLMLNTLPAVLLKNDFVRGLGSIINAHLYEVSQRSTRHLAKYDWL